MHKIYVSIPVVTSYCLRKKFESCFDKMNDGPVFKIISKPIFVFTFYKWPNKTQTTVKASIVDQVHLTAQ